MLTNGSCRCRHALMFGLIISIFSAVTPLAAWSNQTKNRNKAEITISNLQQQLQPLIQKSGGRIDVSSQSSTHGTYLTISSKSNTGNWSSLAPFDDDQRPDCQSLAKLTSQILDVDQNALQYSCLNTPSAHSGVQQIRLCINETTAGLQLEKVEWQLGWLTLHAQSIQYISLDQSKLKQLIEGQNSLILAGNALARKYPGLGLATSSLPLSLWNLVSGSKWSALNLVAAGWHLYEFPMHGLSAWDAWSRRQFYGVAINLLSIGLHGLEGLEHVDRTRIGDHVELGYYNQLRQASGHQHLTHIGVAGFGMFMNVLELVREMDNHGHDSKHTGTGIIGFLTLWHDFIGLFVHIYEVGEALMDWYGDTIDGSCGISEKTCNSHHH